MDKEKAIALARAYLAGGIEIKEISEEETDRLPLYFNGDRHDYYFFYFHGPMEALGVGGSHCVAVSKKTGSVMGMGTVGE
ncbi:MAG: hypothetical protein U9R20_02435 [Thermodesulfobacteriota bacterium]|nr:hypothetical protein [Thermodesulfobacteriota bacterium]